MRRELGCVKDCGATCLVLDAAWVKDNRESGEKLAFSPLIAKKGLTKISK